HAAAHPARQAAHQHPLMHAPVLGQPQQLGQPAEGLVLPIVSQAHPQAAPEPESDPVADMLA
ncbi:hypothetical protein CHLNCDRAFT_135364, partial [Chlorella variabilis]